MFGQLVYEYVLSTPMSKKHKRTPQIPQQQRNSPFARLIRRRRLRFSRQTAETQDCASLTRFTLIEIVRLSCLVARRSFLRFHWYRQLIRRLFHRQLLFALVLLRRFVQILLFRFIVVGRASVFANSCVICVLLGWFTSFFSSCVDFVIECVQISYGVLKFINYRPSAKPKHNRSLQEFQANCQQG